MNFTHLADANELAIDQETLQKFSHFLVIIVNSEAERQWALEETGTPLKMDPNTVCWILTPGHLRLALPGDTLYDVYSTLRDAPATNAAYAFYALVSREALIDDSIRPSVGYVHLEMRPDSRRKARLKQVISDSFKRAKTERSGSPPFVTKILEDIQRQGLVQLLRSLSGSP